MKIQNKFQKIIQMKDKEEAARLVVKNAIKYVQKNGWESSGWTDGSRVCLVGALLEGAGVPVHDEGDVPSCNLKGQLYNEVVNDDGEDFYEQEEKWYNSNTCNTDELLFNKLPNLKNAAYKVLNAHLDEFIDKKKGKLKSLKLKQNKKGEDYYEFEADGVKAEIDELKGLKVSKNDAADAVSSSIQQFNDEILDDEKKAIKFLKDILAEFKDPYAGKKTKKQPPKKAATKAVKKVTAKKEWFEELKTVPTVPEKQQQTVSVVEVSRFSNIEID